MKRLLGCTIITLAASCPTGAMASENANAWLQWRGPQRDGSVDMGDVKSTWPTSLDESHLKQVWRIELGPSYSGPLADDRHVYTTETVGEKNEVVTALNRETGEQVWSTDWSGAIQVPFFAASNGSWIRATPALDDESIYVAGIRDVLVCLNKSTGEQRWRVDFAKRFDTPTPKFGFVASPLVDGDAVYVQAGGGVVKLNKTNGETLWRTESDGGGMNSAFSSPVITELAGRRQLVVQSRQKLMGLRLDTGEEIWSQPIQAFRGMNILTPTVYKDTVFTSAHSGSTQLWNIDQGGSVSEAWKLSAQAYMSSPVVVNGHAYLHLKNQRFACIDLEAGKQKWRTTPFGSYWSMITNRNAILALDSGGTLRLIEASPEEFKLIDERKISQAPTWAHIGLAGNHVLVRELNAMAVYRWQ